MADVKRNKRSGFVYLACDHRYLHRCTVDGCGHCWIGPRPAGYIPGRKVGKPVSFPGYSQVLFLYQLGPRRLRRRFRSQLIELCGRRCVFLLGGFAFVELAAAFIPLSGQFIAFAQQGNARVDCFVV